MSAVGHAKAYTAHFEVAETDVELQPVSLKGASRDLAVVTVTGQKPLVEQKMDRTIVNVEAAVTNVGSNVLEVLEKSPGVQADKDGNISLRGKHQHQNQKEQSEGF